MTQGMVRYNIRSNDEDEEEELPWDPFWEYVLGNEEEDRAEHILPPNTKPESESSQTTDDDSFLDYLFPRREYETREEESVDRDEEESEKEGRDFVSSAFYSWEPRAQTPQIDNKAEDDAEQDHVMQWSELANIPCAATLGPEDNEIQPDPIYEATANLESTNTLEQCTDEDEDDESTQYDSGYPIAWFPRTAPYYSEYTSGLQVSQSSSDPSQTSSQQNETTSHNEYHTNMALFSWPRMFAPTWGPSYSAGTSTEQDGSSLGSADSTLESRFSETTASVEGDNQSKPDSTPHKRLTRSEFHLTFQPLHGQENDLFPIEEGIECEERGVGLNLSEIDERNSLRANRRRNKPRQDDSDSRRQLIRTQCCAIKKLSDEAFLLAMKSGVPMHELTREELSILFPKLRSVADDGAAVLGNSNSFDQSVPAHLQAALTSERGSPQSLLEYEYENGLNMWVGYNQFGASARALLHVYIDDSTPEVHDSRQHVSHQVVVQVEASTVSPTDCSIRRGQWWGQETVPIPNVPGVDVVARIYRVDGETARRYKLSTGDRVISLVRWGGNSRYMAVEADNLVRVSDRIDPAEACCLPDIYLTAFQLIHFGQGPRMRYRKGSLKGKTMVIVGAISSNLGRAISQLARQAAIQNVFALSKPKYFQQLARVDIIPVRDDPAEWMSRFEGCVDLIISTGEEVTIFHHKLLRQDTGEVLMVRQGAELPLSSASTSNEVPGVSHFKMCNRGASQNISKTTHFDIYKEWATHTERCKRDLHHLLVLLEAGLIKPYVLDRIPLTKVARAHELLDSKRINGFLVCEPWLKTKSRAVRL